MSEVYPNQEETDVLPEAKPAKKVTKFDPISIFPNNSKAARFWFFCCIGLFIFVLIQPGMIIEKMKTKERIIIMDETGTFHVSPVEQFEDAAVMHDFCLTVSTQALLNRGPIDVDNPPLLKQTFLKDAYSQAKKYLKEEALQFQKKKLHQKCEIKEFKILKTTDKTVLANVRGQLIRVGTFEGHKFTDTKEFALKIKLFRNPNLTSNGRLPMAVQQWQIQVRDYVAPVEKDEEIKPINTVTKPSEKKEETEASKSEGKDK
jgi:hypothetical protein